MYLQEELKKKNKDLELFEIKNKEGVWIISIYNKGELEYSVSSPHLPSLYQNVINKYGISNKG